MKKFGLAVLLVFVVICCAYQIRLIDDASAPSIHFHTGAFDSTGRYFATGYDGVYHPDRDIAVYSFDGFIWTSLGGPLNWIPKKMVVDRHNVRWIITEGGVLYSHSGRDAVLHSTIGHIKDIAVNNITGDLWLVKVGDPSSIMIYEDGEFRLRRNYRNLSYFALGKNGEYLTFTAEWDGYPGIYRLTYSIYDSLDALVSRADTAVSYNPHGRIFDKGYPIYDGVNDIFYHVVRTDTGSMIMLSFDGERIEILNDTCSTEDIFAYAVDNYGNLVYSVARSTCRDDGIYIHYGDEIQYFEHFFYYQLCSDISVDPYTNNIIFAYPEGYAIYNRDSIWFDIREYTPDDAIKESPKTAIAHHNLNVYPNPAKGKVHIESLAREKLYIYDIKGKLIDILPPGVDVWQPENIPIGTYIFETTRKKDNTKLTSKVLLID